MGVRSTNQSNFEGQTSGFLNLNYSGVGPDHRGPEITATGGTKSTPGDGYIYHKFTSPGNFVVSAGEGAKYNMLVVGAGGGGGDDRGGGGGAGAVYDGTNLSMGPAATYPVVIGSGGAGGVPNSYPQGSRGKNGTGSSALGVTAPGGTGGGGAGSGLTNGVDNSSGGSSGGSEEGSTGGTTTNAPNSGNGPYGYPGRGSPQGSPLPANGGGGGGAGEGGPVNPSDQPGNPDDRGSIGGQGKQITWLPAPIYYTSPTVTYSTPPGFAYVAAGGFGGGSHESKMSPGPTNPWDMTYQWFGAGSGGSPTMPTPVGTGPGHPGLPGTGAGGGGGSGAGPTRQGGVGANGVVIIRYEAAA